jgi:hypothetical protein
MDLPTLLASCLWLAPAALESDKTPVIPQHTVAFHIGKILLFQSSACASPASLAAWWREEFGEAEDSRWQLGLDYVQKIADGTEAHAVVDISQVCLNYFVQN